jgi:hypothetical protein
MFAASIKNESCEKRMAYNVKIAIADYSAYDGDDELDSAVFMKAQSSSCP